MKIASGNSKVRFVIVIILSHTIAYLVSGGIGYQFITKEFWEGSDSLLSSYLRTPGNEALWNFAMIWQIPAQLLRSLLMGLVILPLYDALINWTLAKKILFFSSLMFVFTHLSAAAPSPANIEGLVYMKPEFIRLAFIKMQPEMILHSIVAGLLFARYAFRKDTKQEKEKIGSESN